MEYLRDKEVTPADHEQPLILQLQAELKKCLATRKSVNGGMTNTAIQNFLEDRSLLCKYIRARKNDVAGARKWILRHVRAQVMYPELPPPEKLTEPIRRVLLKSRIYTVLRYADPAGRPIVVADMGAWNPSIIPDDDLTCTCRYLAKRFVDLTNCYDGGVTVIVDAKGASFSHVKLATFSSARKSQDIFHQTHPIPIGRGFIVNAPAFVYPVYSLFRPLIPAKVKDKLVISGGLAELHEQIPLSSLPASLGGELRNEDDVTLSLLGLEDEMF